MPEIAVAASRIRGAALTIGSEVRRSNNEPAADVPPFAWRTVSAVAALAGVLFLTRLGRYEFGGDELYFIAAGHHPAPSYADQGPVVPLLAALADTVAPGSTVALRLPALAMTIAAIVLSALLAREFGGGRLAQTLAAAAYATTPLAVMQSAMLSTFGVDVTLTALVSWLLIRWVRTRRDHLLVFAGVVVAVDFQVKWLIPMVWAGLAVGVLVFGPREMLRRPAWWAGSAIPVASAVPMLWWQHRNGWPQLSMGAVVRDEQLATSGLANMPVQIVMVTGVLGLLLVAGMWAGLRWDRLRPYRFVIPVIAIGLVGIVGGGLRPYFVGGAFPGLFAAGAVYLADRGLSRRAWAAGGGLLALATALCVAVTVMLPLPISRLHTPTDRYSQLDSRSRYFGPSGWDGLVDTVADAYRKVPPDQRPGLVIITQNYWQAAALDHAAPADLPDVYSPNRGYGFFGPPPDTATSVLYVGVDGPSEALQTRFTEQTAIARIDEPLGFPSVDRGVTIWHCRFPSHPWSQAWPEIRTLPLVDGTTR